MPTKNTNLAMFESVRAVDRNFTKPITGKTYKGDSVNPTWVIMRLTECLGPIGQRWGFNVVKETVYNGAPHQVIKSRSKQVYKAGPDADGQIMETKEEYHIFFEQWHQVEIEFWFLGESGRTTFSAFGGTKMFYRAKSGAWVFDEDAAKKSLTDAYTKGASWLGVAADVFLGLFDDKYSGDGQGDGNGQSSGGTAQQPPDGQGQSGGYDNGASNNGGGAQQQQGERQSTNGW